MRNITHCLIALGILLSLSGSAQTWPVHGNPCTPGGVQLLGNGCTDVLLTTGDVPLTAN